MKKWLQSLGKEYFLCECNRPRNIREFRKEKVRVCLYPLIKKKDVEREQY